MAGHEAESTREGMRAVFASTMQRMLDGAHVSWRTHATEAAIQASDILSAAIQKLAAEIESRIYTARHAVPGKGLPPDYAKNAAAVNTALRTQFGVYPDDICALACLDGRMTPPELYKLAMAGIPPPTTRETTLRMFVRTLMSADRHWREQRESALAAAQAIETSCYNAAIRQSKESDEPTRRQWSSPAFVDIYSCRCGVINSLLDPMSTSCREYGPQLASRLLSGDLAPESLGDLKERDLCPAATAAERAEIASRSMQTVAEKESNLFRCPHCKERRCTYREVQRRGLDEPPDYRCMCLACGRRFAGRQD